MLADVPADARVFTEEIFGPVAPIAGFASEDEAIERANDTEYGLVAYVFTQDLKRAIRVCERLETGMIGLNQGMVSNAGAPFGGVKQSGVGREGGNEGIEEYLETKYVADEHGLDAGTCTDPFSGLAALRRLPTGRPCLAEGSAGAPPCSLLPPCASPLLPHSRVAPAWPHSRRRFRRGASTPSRWTVCPGR